MYSVETIDYMENDYVEEVRNRLPEPREVLEEREKTLPPSEPISMLIQRMLRPGPPTLDRLLNLFREPDGLDGFDAFLDLIYKFLPEEEDAILANTNPGDQIQAFISHFSPRYFPLMELDFYYDDGAGEPYLNFTDEVYPEYQGISSYDYDNMPQNGTPIQIAVIYLFENPHVSDDRAAFAEAARMHLPKKVFKQIPEGGFEIGPEMDEALRGTPYETLAFMAHTIERTVHNYLPTDNLFFDVATGDDESSALQVVWNRPTVMELTRQYQEFLHYNEVIGEFSEEMGKDLPGNIEKIVKLLKEKEVPVINEPDYYEKLRQPTFSDAERDDCLLRPGDLGDNWPEGGPDQGEFPDL